VYILSIFISIISKTLSLFQNKMTIYLFSKIYFNIYLALLEKIFLFSFENLFWYLFWNYFTYLNAKKNLFHGNILEKLSKLKISKHLNILLILYNKKQKNKKKWQQRDTSGLHCISCNVSILLDEAKCMPADAKLPTKQIPYIELEFF